MASSTFEANSSYHTRYIRSISSLPAFFFQARTLCSNDPENRWRLQSEAKRWDLVLSLGMCQYSLRCEITAVRSKSVEYILLILQCWSIAGKSCDYLLFYCSDRICPWWYSIMGRLGKAGWIYRDCSLTLFVGLTIGCQGNCQVFWFGFPEKF
jgi:hypothetical protein